MSEANGALGQPLELAHRSMLILYGTETGHSQEIAEELADMALRLRFELSLEEMNGVDLVSVQAGSRNFRVRMVLENPSILSPANEQAMTNRK